MEIIAWVGFSQSLFAAILVMAKRKNSVSDKILSAWLWLLAIEFLTLALDYRVLGKPLLSGSFLLINPAFFLYVASLIKEDFRLRWTQLLHLAPFVFFETFAYVIYQHFSLEAYFSGESRHWYGLLFSLATFLSWIFYNFSSIELVVKQRGRLFNEFSNIESNRSLGWLLFVVVFYNLYCLVTVATAIVALTLKVNFLLPHIVNYSFLLALVYALGFYGLRQQTVFIEPDPAGSADETHRQMLLSPERVQRIKEQLFEFFEKEQPYLNPELNMRMISEQLQVPKHQITMVLNAEIGKNFFQFVNEYRVGAVKIRLAQTGNIYSIESIGYDCGFSSKSSFFTVFKKLTGQTPFHYKQSVQT